MPALPADCINYVYSFLPLEDLVGLCDDATLLRHYNYSKIRMSDAAANGQLKTLDWIHRVVDQGQLYHVTSDYQGNLCTLLDIAAMNGHIHIMEWLKSKRMYKCLHPETVPLLVITRNVESLHWLYTTKHINASYFLFMDLCKHYGRREIPRPLEERVLQNIQESFRRQV
jgi:uncharacterized protein YerC